MLGLFTNRLAGPIASGVAAVLALALIFVWISGRATERALNGRIAALEQSIDAPQTGWRARLTQCQANLSTVSKALDEQSAQVGSWKAAADEATARANTNATAARVARTAAEKSAATILNLKPGADRCASALELIRSP